MFRRNEVDLILTQHTWLSSKDHSILQTVKLPRHPFELSLILTFLIASTWSFAFFSSSTWQGSSFDTYRLNNGICADDHRQRLSWSFLCGGNNCGTFLWRSASCLCVGTTWSSCVISQPNGFRAQILAILHAQNFHWSSWYLLLKMEVVLARWVCWKIVSLN